MDPPAAPPTHTTAIFVVGPSSTGKTTLCTALARRLGLPHTAHIAEAARTVMRRTGFTRADVSRLAMQAAILEAQLDAERAALAAQPPVLLSDRSAVDPVVYAVLTAPTAEDADARRRELVKQAKFQEALAVYRHAVVVLLCPVAGWLVDDGVRSLDDQEKCLEVFRTVLAELDIGYSEIGPSTQNIEERVAMVIGLARL